MALATLARTPPYLILLGEGLLVSSGVWILANWLPLFLHDRFDSNLTESGFQGTFWVQTAVTFGFVVGGFGSDRAATHEKTSRFRRLGGLYLFAAPFALTFVLRPPEALVLAAVFLFSFLRAAGSANEHPLLCEVVPPGLRSIGVGVFNFVNCLSGGVGTFLAGYAKQSWGLDGVFASISPLAAAAGLLAIWGYSIRAQDQPEMEISRASGS